jgi:hypothetical protein
MAGSVKIIRGLMIVAGWPVKIIRGVVIIIRGLMVIISTLMIIIDPLMIFIGGAYDSPPGGGDFNPSVDFL